MIQCPVCRRSLSASSEYPDAPICSEGCRRDALRRAGVAEEPQPQAEQFQALRATHLFCRTCGGSMPARERLLLALPTGDLYGYTCARCGADVGTRTAAQ
ncbi:MAG TPA: hypothetical protein VGB20_04705 [bacterium]